MRWPKHLRVSSADELKHECWQVVSLDGLDALLKALEKSCGPKAKDPEEPDEEEWEAFIDLLLDQRDALHVQALEIALKDCSEALRSAARSRTAAARKELKAARTLWLGDIGYTATALLPVPSCCGVARILEEGAAIAWVVVLGP